MQGSGVLELQEDGDQHTNIECMYGGGSRLRRHVVKLCGKRLLFFKRDGLHLRGKGAAVLGCEFVRVIDEGTGTINYLN